jgi:Patatin-like phospholipase
MTTQARPPHEARNVIGMLRSEIDAINERRHALGRDRLPVRAGCEPPVAVIDAVGLALSGGGIRSAAVSLGVLQALNHHNALRNVDYLSTVSGGGYMGTSLTATMSKSGGRFVFANPRSRDDHTPLSAEIMDTAEVGHIRNYSNYLFPAGTPDVLTGTAIVLRGLVTNLALVLPFILLAAAVTIWSNPSRSSLEVTNVLGYSLASVISLPHFGITLSAALLGLVLCFGWALVRSFLRPRHLSEFHGWLPFLAGSYLVLLVNVFICEAQSFVIDGMFTIYDAQATGRDVFLGLVTSWVKTLAAITAPIAAVVMFFRNQLGEILKSVTAGSSWTKQAAAWAIKASVWIAGLAVPLLIWVAYLYLTFWGIINDRIPTISAAACPRGAISASVRIDDQELTYRGDLERVPAAGGACTQPGGDPKPVIGPGTHTPRWLLGLAGHFADAAIYVVDRIPLPNEIWQKARALLTDRPLTALYALSGALLVILAWPLKPNANSLHRLYRDRLSKAFLFDPDTQADPRRLKANWASRDQGRDFAPLDDMLLSELSVKHAPYHLINAALNIQGSDYANRRGRNADFFLFSPRYIGSYATDYAAMQDFQRAAPDLDLATATAISGAAASSNMGSSSIRPLTPTLALLNVRLGYWLKNPLFHSPSNTRYERASRFREWTSRFYLWAEITGRLYENASEVYLTDGGHIENLGVYELLRRRCKVIVVVDAEADLAMHFPALVRLQRYARIDLGIRIDLPWEPIQTVTLAQMQPPAPAATPPKSSPGPHVAVGTIDYGGGHAGYLVYVKSSLTGDENDYIRDYARRYATFPHEITLDQLFSEEQFEVYRALGFHMMDRALSGQDCVCANGVSATGEPEVKKLKLDDASNPTLAAVHGVLAPAA